MKAGYTYSFVLFLLFVVVFSFSTSSLSIPDDVMKHQVRIDPLLSGLNNQPCNDCYASCSKIKSQDLREQCREQCLGDAACSSDTCTDCLYRCKSIESPLERSGCTDLCDVNACINKPSTPSALKPLKQVMVVPKLTSVVSVKMTIPLGIKCDQCLYKCGLIKDENSKSACYRSCSQSYGSDCSQPEEQVCSSCEEICSDDTGSGECNSCISRYCNSNMTEGCITCNRLCNDDKSCINTMCPGCVVVTSCKNCIDYCEGNYGCMENVCESCTFSSKDCKKCAESSYYDRDVMLQDCWGCIDLVTCTNCEDWCNGDRDCKKNLCPGCLSTDNTKSCVNCPSFCANTTDLTVNDCIILCGQGNRRNNCIQTDCEDCFASCEKLPKQEYRARCREFCPITSVNCAELSCVQCRNTYCSSLADPVEKIECNASCPNCGVVTDCKGCRLGCMNDPLCMKAKCPACIDTKPCNDCYKLCAGIKDSLSRTQCREFCSISDDCAGDSCSGCHSRCNSIKDLDEKGSCNDVCENSGACNEVCIHGVCLEETPYQTPGTTISKPTFIPVNPNYIVLVPSPTIKIIGTSFSSWVGTPTLKWFGGFPTPTNYYSYPPPSPQKSLITYATYGGSTSEMGKHQAGEIPVTVTQAVPTLSSWGGSWGSFKPVFMANTSNGNISGNTTLTFAIKLK